MTTPKYKWGSVSHGSVGVVTEISGPRTDVRVDFPQQNKWVGLLAEMELVPSCHAGVTCDGCQAKPLMGPRFRCKACDNFDYCERCFYGRRGGGGGGHKHSFSRMAEPGGAAVFAGRPGQTRRRRSDASSSLKGAPSSSSSLLLAGGNCTAATAAAAVPGLVEEWGDCVKSMGVSSRESWAYRLTDGTSSYWQSCGTQGKHWIRLEMQEDVAVHTLRIQVDPGDSTYMPSVVQVNVGDAVSALREITAVTLTPSDTIVTLLSGVREYFRYVEIAVKQCRNGGIDCKVHGLQVVGRRRGGGGELDEDEAYSSSVSFLASDSEECEGHAGASPYSRARGAGGAGGGGDCKRDAQATKVYVWGLNDKDQLGGLKGSKIKLPVLSDTLGNLKPIHIAGGSKSLFTVTQEGRVYACGEGTNGRLGLGHSNNVSAPRQITALAQYVVKKVAVHSGGKHAMALTVDGRVFSWGEGDDGKLGHCSRLSCDKPRLIEALKSKRVRDIACGSSHSAAITSSGELYTWGCGEYGRLGHGDNVTQLRPKQVSESVRKFSLHCVASGQS